MMLTLHHPLCSTGESRPAATQPTEEEGLHSQPPPSRVRMYTPCPSIFPLFLRLSQ